MFSREYDNFWMMILCYLNALEGINKKISAVKDSVCDLNDYGFTVFLQLPITIFLRFSLTKKLL